METIFNILFGLQIGLLVTASYHCFRIALSKITPTFPYMIAGVALMLMASWRMNQIFEIVNKIVVIIGTTVICLLWLMFFVKIRILLEGKLPHKKRVL